jgi:hypothetical protein
MSEHYEKHAEQVANSFIEMLDEAVSAQITGEQRNELAMLVEAAISTAVLEQLVQAADQVAALSDGLRRHAENYDKAQ